VHGGSALKRQSARWVATTKFASIIDRLVTWIPGDTLALYVPGVALIAARPNASPSSLFLIVMLVVNPLIITSGTFAAGTASTSSSG
jgi:hypothetical protein